MTINVASPLIHERNLAKRPSPIPPDGTLRWYDMMTTQESEPSI